MERFPGFAFDNIRYVDEVNFTGYLVQMEKGKQEVNLRIAANGQVLEERMSE
ncbi:MAG: hypothetical protein ACLFUB_09465 [Cyclobacteriaceae bacterium]